MRTVAAIIVALPLLAACSTTSGGAANASCAGPLLDAVPPGAPYDRTPGPTVPAGAELTIYGHWFTSTCNDTSNAHDPMRPLPPETLTLTLPGAATPVPLGTFTPSGKDLGFRVTVHVPGDTPAGPAVVAGQEGRTFGFTVASPTP